MNDRCHERVTRDAVTCHAGRHGLVTPSRPVPSRPAEKTLVTSSHGIVQLGDARDRDDAMQVTR